MKNKNSRNKFQDTPDEAEDETITSNTSNATEGLTAAGIYYISGEIKTGGLKTICEDILLKSMMGEKFWNHPIQIIVNSPGGDADEMWALLDIIANCRIDVYTVGLGACASAAAMLLASGSKGHRTAGANLQIMIHRYSWGTYDKQHELVAHRKAEDIEHKKMIDFWIHHSKYKSRKEVEKHLLLKEDNWMTAKEALKHGIIDKIGGSVR